MSTGGHVRVRRWLKRAAKLAGVMAVASVLLAAWLVRDPSNRFEARRGTLDSATLQESARVEDHVEELVALRSSSGLAVELAIKRPSGDAPPGGRAVALLLGGVESGRKALRFVPDTRGTIVVAMSYPYTGPKKPKGLAFVSAAPAIRAALRDTAPAIRLVLDWILAQPDVDRARIELVGVSLGAPFACIAGALDDRFARVWAIHGGGDVPGMLDAGLKRKIGFAPARWIVSRLGWIVAGGPPLAPERWVASIAPRPFVLVGARADERVPRASTEILFAAAREPKELVWFEGGHVDTDRLKIAQELVDLVLSRMAGG
jgi:dienelactone hydrolase